MAGPGQHGYDLKFVNEVQDTLVCKLCNLVARDPQQMNCCGKLYCQLCLSEHQQQNSNECPECKKAADSFRDIRSENDINDLKVKCNNHDNGCNWTEELCKLEEHLKECGYIEIPCSNECKQAAGGAIFTVLRKDLDDHLKNKCPRRQHECSFCHESGEYQERVGKHLETCPCVIITCSNKGCSEEIQRGRNEEHKLTCNFEPVPCKYAEVGCKETPARKDLQKHEENDQQHLRIVTENVLEQKKETERMDTEAQRLNEEVQRLTQLIRKIEDKTSRHIGSPFTFKVTEFNAKKQGDQPFFTLPLYSSRKGYKICFSVYANGDADGKGSHVSVFAHFMKGEYDDTLTWPFTGTVTFELRNQLGDYYNHKKTVTFPADNEESQRVEDDERGKGYGFPMFALHSDLDYRRIKKTQYLKDDALIFKVSVEEPESWLQCD